MTWIRFAAGIRSGLRIPLIVGLLCIAAADAHAIADSIRLSQLGHTAWRMREGAFNGSPTSIAQTSDGYLWIGTDKGLLRFDGVRFDVVALPPAPPGSEPVVALLAARDGSLWIGTANGMLRLYKGAFQAYPSAGKSIEFAEGEKGSIWFTRATDERPFCKWSTDDSVKCFGAESGFAVPGAGGLTKAADDSLWISHFGGVAHWSEGHATDFALPTPDRRSRRPELANAVFVDGACAWVASARAGPGLGSGLQSLCNGAWQGVDLGGVETKLIQNIRRDSAGDLWIGTASDGLYLVRAGQVDHYGIADGLSDNNVLKIFVDREGSTWTVTGTGIDRFRVQKVTSYATIEGLSAGAAGSLLARANGDMVIGNAGSLDWIKKGRISSWALDPRMRGLRVTSLLEDRAGALWVGVDRRLFVKEDSGVREITVPGPEPFGEVHGLAQSTDRDIWALTELELVRIRDDKVAERFPLHDIGPVESIAASPEEGLFVGLAAGGVARFRRGRLDSTLVVPQRFGKALTVMVDPDGTGWAATREGLVTWKDGALKRLDASSGLPCTVVYAIVRSPDGDLWLSQSCGYVRIAAEQSKLLWTQHTVKIKADLLDALDGAFPALASYTPGATASADGSVWFANDNFVQRIDAAHLPMNRIVPQVHIEHLFADKVDHPLLALQPLAAGTRDLQIDYTALSLGIPQKVRFRYKLNGWDEDWQDPGGRRQAFYTNLAPGRYTFHVKASNDDGLWNEEGDTLAFTILPAYYQTVWFACISAICAFIFLNVAYCLRIQQLTGRVRDRLLERLSERERIARDLHDSFFQGIQGLLLRFNTSTARLQLADPARTSFIETLEQSDQVMLQGRELLLDLRSKSEGVALPTLLTSAGEEFKVLHPAEFRSLVIGQPRDLQPLCAEELLRLGREALYNAFRHAHARSIEVELTFDETTLVLRVRDDGRGIDDDILKRRLRAGHWGLPGMYERAATIGADMQLRSRVGGGTELEVIVPGPIAYTGYRTAPWRDALRRFISRHNMNK